MIGATQHNRRDFLRRAGLVAAIAQARVDARDEARMPNLDGAVGWLNTAHLTDKALRGRVVLVNFWTYSCINSLRELPYMKAWAEKYREYGLIVLGVHSPEFDFEKDSSNVAEAVAFLKIKYPVAIDSHHVIWRAFKNEYWPADYIVDAQGRLRYHHFGEGDYAHTERMIQSLIKESGVKLRDEGTVHPIAEGPEAPPSDDIRSPETYLGYARAERFASADGLVRDTSRDYRVPARLAINTWALGGLWKVGRERAACESAGGRIAFRFHSRDLHLVLGTNRKGTPVRFQVKVDGLAPGADLGSDCATDGSGVVREPRMYQLIRRKANIQDASFEIEFLDAGIEAFSVTFG